MDCSERPNLKKCSVCKVWKPYNSIFFFKDSSRISNLGHRCKVCDGKASRLRKRKAYGYNDPTYHEVKSEIYKEIIDKFGGTQDVNTWGGIVDVLTPSYLFEVKRLHRWKDALGQLLVYRLSFPNHIPVAILYGPKELSDFDRIKQIFSSFGMQAYQRIGNLSANTDVSGCS